MGQRYRLKTVCNGVRLPVYGATLWFGEPLTMTPPTDV
ncbi:hypothetical protein SCH4B_2462 [Ruegeria sp. TrichCH4B]|nr:hypothetical protein SCH4B_2462 [Ruegeria sp. TrichCH4B]